MDTPQSSDEIHTQIGDNASGIAVGKQITQNVTQHFYNQPAPSTDSMLDFAAVEQRYRAQVVKYYNKLALTGLPERDPGLHEIALEQIFVKLNIELPQPAGPDFLGFDDEYRPSGDRSTVSSAVEHKRHMREMARRPTPVTLSVAEALQRHTQLVIIGGPGSGKTTLTRWLAVVFARREQAKPENLGTALAGDRLPIMLELRRFAEHFVTLSQQPTVPDLAGEIASFISRHAYYPDTPAAFIQQALTDGRCLILLDGLDEIADLGARQLLTDAVHSFVQHPMQSYRNNLLLVTSRPHGYQSISLSAFQECEVKPFTLDDVALFIRHWYATAYPDQEQSEAADLTAAIQANERVGELATNPLLCTIIAIVYRNNRVLPNRRVELYLKCCEALLDTWERNKALKTAGLIAGYDWQTKLELLAPVAYWLHNEAERLAAPEADFVKQLAQVLIDKKLGDLAKADQEARQFIALIRDRSGLLQGRGDGTLEFTHRTFQEYLAARHISAQPYPDYIDWVMVHLHEAWWREVHLLVIGHLGSGMSDSAKASQILTTILTLYRPPWHLLPAYYIPRQTRINDNLDDDDERFSVRLTWQAFRTYFRFGRLLPGWQLERRLAWLLQREFELVARGFLECVPLGTTKEFKQELIAHATILMHTAITAGGSHGIESPFMQTLYQVLRQQPSPAVIEALQRALEAPEWRVRLMAINILVQLGQESPELPKALWQALEDSYDIGRERVHPSSVPTLMSIGRVRSEMVERLVYMPHFPFDPVPDIAAIALWYLGQMNQRVEFGLQGALYALDRQIRAIAVDALGQLGQMRPELVEEVVEALLLPLNDDSQSARTATAKALGRLGQANPKVVDLLLQALNDEDESYIRAVAADGLGQLGQANPKVVEALQRAINVPNDPEKYYPSYLRIAAAGALIELGIIDPTVLDALLQELNEPNNPADFHRMAAAALARLGQTNPSAINVLIQVLNDGRDTFTRAAAADALGQQRQASPEIVKALLQALNRGDLDYYVSAAAATALGRLGQASVEVIEALQHSLVLHENEVRVAAASALGQLSQKSSSAVDGLLQALNDIDQHVRAVAAYELGGSKIEGTQQYYRILTALNRCLHDTNDDVRLWALTSARAQLEGRLLPGYVWILIRARLERQRRINQFGWWAWLVCGLVLAALVIVYLSAQLDANSLLVRFGAAVALITGLAAGVAQVLGWTLRNPYGKHEP